MSKELDYDEALKYILDQHQLWLDTDGKKGVRLKLIDKNLEKADFERTNFEGAHLEYALFFNAQFRGADMRYSDFRGAYFEGADLRCVDF